MVSVTERPLRILLVDADDTAAERVRAMLNDNAGTAPILTVVQELGAALERVAHGGVDLVLMELDLPDSRGVVAFERMHAFAADVPILILAHERNEEVALATVQGGAQDYLVHGEVRGSDLRRAIQYALERHRLLSALRSLSLIDDLTGLYNRRGFIDLGTQYLKLGRRSGQGAAVVFVDVDNFKSINDALGHHVGDRALLRAAEILRVTFRRSDIVARMGGDEFAVLAQDSHEDPQVLAQRVREAFSSFSAATRDPYQLFVSVGATRADAESRLGLEELLATADAAMYEEKRSKQKVRAS